MKLIDKSRSIEKMFKCNWPKKNLTNKKYVIFYGTGKKEKVASFVYLKNAYNYLEKIESKLCTEQYVSLYKLESKNLSVTDAIKG